MTNFIASSSIILAKSRYTKLMHPGMSSKMKPEDPDGFSLICKFACLLYAPLLTFSMNLRTDLLTFCDAEPRTMLIELAYQIQFFNVRSFYKKSTVKVLICTPTP